MCLHVFYDGCMTKNHGDHWLREMFFIILYQIPQLSCVLSNCTHSSFLFPGLAVNPEWRQLNTTVNWPVLKGIKLLYLKYWELSPYLGKAETGQTRERNESNELRKKRIYVLIITSFPPRGLYSLLNSWLTSSCFIFKNFYFKNEFVKLEEDK